MELDRLEQHIVDDCKKYLEKKHIYGDIYDSEERILEESLRLLKKDANNAYSGNRANDKTSGKILRVQAVLDIVRKKKEEAR